MWNKIGLFIRKMWYAVRSNSVYDYLKSTAQFDQLEAIASGMIKEMEQDTAVKGVEKLKAVREKLKSHPISKEIVVFMPDYVLNGFVQTVVTKLQSKQK